VGGLPPSRINICIRRVLLILYTISSFRIRMKRRRMPVQSCNVTIMRPRRLVSSLPRAQCSLEQQKQKEIRDVERTCDGCRCVCIPTTQPLTAGLPTNCPPHPKPCTACSRKAPCPAQYHPANKTHALHLVVCSHFVSGVGVPSRVVKCRVRTG
jgi:hypothetical protein